MDYRWITRTLAVGLVGSWITASSATETNTDFLAKSTWQSADHDLAYDALLEYLSRSDVGPDLQTNIRDRWSAVLDADQESADVLDVLAECLALVDDRVRELVEYCALSEHGPRLPEFAWLADSATPELVRHNMRLYLARWLAENGYYDEAIGWTDGLTTEMVVAPEALLYYRAIAHHLLVQPDKADAAVVQLLEQSDTLPLRYRKLAQLMQQDLATLEDDSLNHIARRMADVRRRLEQGRTGEGVQLVENGVIESLDKLIKEIEDQLQQQQSSSGSGSGGQQSSTPMNDSRIALQKAPGRVDHKDIGDGTDWGNLSPKDREQALQEIGREFPSHYREVIEEYFRRLASDDSASTP